MFNVHISGLKKIIIRKNKHKLVHSFSKRIVTHLRLTQWIIYRAKHSNPNANATEVRVRVTLKL